MLALTMVMIMVMMMLTPHWILESPRGRVSVCCWIATPTPTPGQHVAHESSLITADRVVSQ